MQAVSFLQRCVLVWLGAALLLLNSCARSASQGSEIKDSETFTCNREGLNSNIAQLQEQLQNMAAVTPESSDAEAVSGASPTPVADSDSYVTAAEEDQEPVSAAAAVDPLAVDAAAGEEFGLADEPEASVDFQNLTTQAANCQAPAPDGGSVASGKNPDLVTSTPALITFIKNMNPPPKSAADVFNALKASGNQFSNQVGTVSTESAQPADPSQNAPRCFVTINGTTQCSIGPEGRIEVATFPTDKNGKPLAQSDDNQFADIEFEEAHPDFDKMLGSDSHNCNACHGLANDPIAIGNDPDGNFDQQRAPFPLQGWYQANCVGTIRSPMCAQIKSIL